MVCLAKYTSLLGALAIIATIATLAATSEGKAGASPVQATTTAKGASPAMTVPTQTVWWRGPNP